MLAINNISKSVQDTLDSLPYFGPEFCLAIGFLVVIILDLFIKKPEKAVFAAALISLMSSSGLVIQQLYTVDQKLILFNGMFFINHEAVLFKLLILLSAILSLIFFSQDNRLITHRKGINDFYTIFLGAVLGMLTLISSANMLMVFISIEMISLASYLMVSYTAEKPEQAEAGIKYVLFGAITSAIMLYGISFMYGFSGSLDLFTSAIPDGLNEAGPIAKNMVLILMMAGIGFKLSFVPFHFWTPDAYQASPTSVTSFLATMPKIAVFAFLFSINNLLASIGDIYHHIIIVISIASMIIGNIMALFQQDIKRLMAYSSIGHTGFILMLFILPEIDIFPSLFYYLFVYITMNVGAFMSFAYLESSYGVINLKDLKGLGKSFTFIATAIVIFTVSLIGLPPTGGFIAKFLVLSSIISQLDHSNSIILIIVAIITTVISLFYYFKFPLYLFLQTSDKDSIRSSRSLLLGIIVILIILILITGLFPSLYKF